MEENSINEWLKNLKSEKKTFDRNEIIEKLEPQTEEKTYSVLNLRLFKKTYPLIIDIIKTIISIDNQKHKKLIDAIYSDCLEVLGSLSSGYNSYHRSAKAKLYSDVRNKLSRLQVFILMMNSLGLLKERQVSDYYNSLEEIIVASGGLIRKMEKSAPDDK